MRLRGDAADNPVSAAKADGRRIAMAQAISTQAPGARENTKHTSAGAAVAVRGDMGNGATTGGRQLRRLAQGPLGCRIAMAWVDCCGGFLLASA